MEALIVALLAASGVYLVYSAVMFDRRSLFHPDVVVRARHYHNRFDAYLYRNGIPVGLRRQAGAFMMLLFMLGGMLGWALFGGILAPLGVAVFAASFPFATYRSRRAHRRAIAAESWPRMIEELRIQCSSVGRPIPQALWDIGRRGPSEYREAFHEAERDWHISMDFARAIDLLKRDLNDPTADVTCETLLIAHEVGGNDVDRKLAALIEDRYLELNGRKDARAKQSGVKFARRFVLIVPIGMAVAGMSIGNGRDAYTSAQGQMGILAALVLLGICWLWSGRLIAIPGEKRVLGD